MKIHSKWSRITSAMLSVVLLLTILFTNMPTGVLSVSAADSDFARGVGTSDDPYIIETAAQLDNVRNYLGEEHSDKYFELGSDIDLTDYLADGGAGNEKWSTYGWQPIGDYENLFIGSFDGANHKITGLWIGRPRTACVGLFGYVSGEIKNLGVEIDDSNGGVNGDDCTGGLVGKQDGGSITDCYATGSVNGNYSNTGGLVGNSYGNITSSYATGSVTSSGFYSGGLVGNSYGNITSSYATGSVTSRDSYSGGLVGEQVGGIIKDCYATGSVNGKRHSNGGLVGSSPFGSITNSYATGDVLGEDYTGGLVGYKDSGDIENSYATGSVTGDYSTGGLVGVSNGSITNSYAAGSVTGNNDTGGLVGRNDVGSSITSSYFDMQTTGFEDGVGNNPSAGGVTGLTTVEMSGKNAFDNMTFDFIDNWTVRPDTSSSCCAVTYYPELKVFADSDDEFTASSSKNSAIATTADHGNETHLDIGKGTDGNPYKIYTAKQLNHLRSHLEDNYYYELANDIDLSGFNPNDDPDGSLGLGWEPIGSSTADGWNRTVVPFCGEFDGAGNKITGLWIDRSSQSKPTVGLFGAIDGAEIKNLGVEIDDSRGVIGDGYYGVGGLVGFLRDSVIESCYTTGPVTSTSTNIDYVFVGGLVGMVSGNDTFIRNCYTTGDVVGNVDVGGLVGGQYSGVIENCYTAGNVKGELNTAGGLVGNSEGLNCEIRNCYSTGEVSSSIGKTGGLVGHSNGSMENCYSTGEVSASGEGDVQIGGLAGTSRGSMENCYAVGQLSVSKTGGVNVYEGGLIGFFGYPEPESEEKVRLYLAETDDASIIGCYFNTQTTGQKDGVGNDSNASGVTGLTTAEMVSADTLTTGAMSGLDDTFWSKRAATSNYCYYPELKAYYEGSDVQMAASEASTRLERLEITLNAGSLSASPITYGDKLSSSTITGEVDCPYEGQKISGTFAWSDGSVVPTINNNGFSMTFTPESELYKAASISIPVTVNKAVLIVTAEDASRMQGMENPDLGFRYSGFVKGEDESVLSKKPTISTIADKNSPSGKYDIIVFGGEADNYEFEYIKGILTVIVDTSKLEAAIKQAQKVDKGDYSENCWQDFQDALEIANDTLNKDGVTQAEVYEATQILLDAIDALVHEYEFIFKFDTFTGASKVSGTVNAPYNKFVRLLIDGEEVDSSNYTITEGSTVITLSDEYLKTLKDGSYTIKVEFSDGSATTTLTINVDKGSSTSSDGSSTSSDDKSSSKFGTAPSTGDSIIFSFILLMAASLSLLIVFKKKSR
ncbi:MAG: GLUG motif-containing protein [Lachnospiraceae bacterium]